jgi:hypothetical protein
MFFKINGSTYIISIKIFLLLLILCSDVFSIDKEGVTASSNLSGCLVCLSSNKLRYRLIISLFKHFSSFNNDAVSFVMIVPDGV